MLASVPFPCSFPLSGELSLYYTNLEFNTRWIFIHSQDLTYLLVVFVGCPFFFFFWLLGQGLCVLSILYPQPPSLPLSVNCLHANICLCHLTVLLDVLRLPFSSVLLDISLNLSLECNGCLLNVCWMNG